MSYLKLHQSQYQTIYLTRELGRPSIYCFFYQSVDPNLVQQEEGIVKHNQGERLEYQNIKFFLPDQKDSLSLVVDTPHKTQDKDIIYTVTDKLGQPIFNLYETK